MNSRYDIVIIGGGHNGLVCAAYLAKAGKKICVIERRHVLGGCAATEALWPGYKVSTAAYVVSLFLPQIIRDLRLKQYGLTILPRTPSSFTPLPDGRSLLLGPDAALCQGEISKFSTNDADAYPRYNALLERIAGVIEPVLSQAAPDPLPLPSSWRKIGMAKRLRDATKLWSIRQAMANLGDDLPEAVELLTGAARPILDRWFETDVLKTTLATDAIIGAFLSISSPGSAYVLLHHVMGEAGGARGVWGYVRGGMGALSDAIAAACEDLRVTIRRETAVRRITTRDGRAVGVALEDGTEIEADAIGSSVDPHLTFEKFLTSDDLPEDFRAAVGRIDYASASAKVNLALGEPPRFTCIPEDATRIGIGPHHHGTMHISPSLDYLERAYDDAKYGRPSEHPILEATMATSVDSSIAPEGKHILSIFVQYAPYNLDNGCEVESLTCDQKTTTPLNFLDSRASPEDGGGGSGNSVERGPARWDEIKESFGDRCVEELAKYAPNVPNAIEHRQVLSPLDLERTFGITGGNIMQGAMNANQLYCFRPVAGWADHRTPLPGLYLCGAASHPGGGVMGACGKNAAEEILRDW